MEVDLLQGYQIRPPHPEDPRVAFQCAVADVRDLGLTLERNVLEQLVDRTERQLRKNGVRTRVGVTQVGGVPFLRRHYLNGDTFVSYFSPEARDNLKDGIIIRKIDYGRRSIVGVGINSDQIIQVMMDCLTGKRITRLLEVSALHNRFDCAVYTICGDGMYSYTASPADVDPAIVNYTGQIRAVTQQVANILA